MNKSDWLYALWGIAMAGFGGYGFATITYDKNYRRGIPCAIVGLALYAALWFTIP